MTFVKPDKPTKLRGVRGTMDIVTNADTTTASGMYVPGSATTVTDIPITMSIVTPSEAFKLGHDTDETIWRLRAPIRHQDGSDIRLTHNQYIVVTDAQFTAEDFTVIGRGQMQGRSGIQTAIVRREAR